MDARDSVLKTREEISARFPNEAKLADAYLAENWFDADAHEIWLEQFSQETTDAMSRRDEASVMEHLSFISQLLRNADAAVGQYIDVCYVESLMWNLDEETKAWAWRLIPENLKSLYVAMWGEFGSED
jgi:hypothetical protein